MPLPLRSVLLLLLALQASGCSRNGVMDRPGTWQATGANDQNLKVMLANPGDLQRGEAAYTDRGNSPARAVTRLLTDRRRPLLNAAASQVGGTAQESSETPSTGSGPPAAGGSNATP